MDNNEEIEGGSSEDNEFGSGRGGRKYRPVVAHDNDRAVVEMSCLDPSGSSSSSPFPDPSNSLKLVRTHTLSLYHSGFALIVISITCLVNVFVLDATFLHLGGV